MQPKNLERDFYVGQQSVFKFTSGYFFFSPVLLDYVMLKGMCVFFYLPLLGTEHTSWVYIKCIYTIG